MRLNTCLNYITPYNCATNCKTLKSGSSDKSETVWEDERQILKDRFMIWVSEQLTAPITLTTDTVVTSQRGHWSLPKLV